jgi:hypothetical protein
MQNAMAFGLTTKFADCGAGFGAETQMQLTRAIVRTFVTLVRESGTTVRLTIEDGEVHTVAVPEGAMILARVEDGEPNATVLLIGELDSGPPEEA